MNSNIRVAGIDYSITCPCMCIDDEFFYFTKIKKYQINTKFYHGFEYPDTRDNSEKFDILSNKFVEILNEHEIDVVFLEGYAFASKGLVFTIGENTGVLKNKLYRANVNVLTPSPSTIKKFATGTGRASKEEMYKNYYKKTGIDLESAGFKIGGNPSSDIVDSYYLKEYGNLEVSK